MMSHFKFCDTGLFFLNSASYSRGVMMTFEHILVDTAARTLGLLLSSILLLSRL